MVQEQTAGAVAGQLQSPDYLTSRALDSALYPKNDPQLREATPATVRSLALENVAGYYQHVFRPDLTTIVVIGKVTREQAKAAVEKYFGEWNASGPPPETDLPTVPANSSGVTAVPDKSRVQVNATLAETLELNRFNPDYYALELGNHVLGGGFYATRLYQDLRESTGLVYFVSSSFGVGKTRSVYPGRVRLRSAKRVESARRGCARSESDADGASEHGRFAPGQGDAVAADSFGRRERPAHCRGVDIPGHDWLAAGRTECSRAPLC